MNASVVITTKNRKEELLKAVESAMAQRVLLEVIVIDDGSMDGTVEELQKQFSVFSFQSQEEKLATSDSRLATAPEALSLDSGRSTLDPQTAAKPQLRLIRHEESRGLIVRRNEGARLAKGDVIFSLDDDAVFSSPFVVQQTLRDFSHPRIGAVAIPYIEPHKANTEMQRAPTREDIWITASYIGTAHAVRRDVFLALGGYREHLVHQGEEGDFCLRMLAAKRERKADFTTEDTTERLGGREMEQPKVGPKGEEVGTTESKGTEDESVLTTSEHLGRCEVEQSQIGPKGEGVGATDSKSTEGQAGPCLDKPGGAAFSNPSTSEIARDFENTSLIRSADNPSSLPATSHPQPATAPEAQSLDSGPSTLDAAPLSAVPGFFVRLGNSDPIIHNESPKRDYSRMDFYGRRNDVLFHWQNTPMPDLLWQLPKTIAGGLLCAHRVKRWRKMLEGIGAGLMQVAVGVKREPVSKLAFSNFKQLKARCCKLRT